MLRDGERARAGAGACWATSFRARLGRRRRAADGYTRAGADRLAEVAMAATMQHYVDHFEDSPGDRARVPRCATARRRPTRAPRCIPACQNLLLAARALGYGGALTMWHPTSRPSCASCSAIPDGVALSACITLGVPAGHHGPVRRKPLAEVVYDDSWGHAPDWV